MEPMDKNNASTATKQELEADAEEKSVDDAAALSPKLVDLVRHRGRYHDQLFGAGRGDLANPPARYIVALLDREPGI